MKGDWKEFRLGDLGDIITGRTPPSSRPDCFGDKYPFITPSDMDGRKRASTTQRYLSDSGADLLRRNLLPSGSVAVSCIGWQMGKVIMTACPSFTNQQLNTIIPHNAVGPDFLYYSLVPWRDHLLSLGSGTGVRTPILNKSAFSDLRLSIPTLDTQQRIARVLSAYDDLIENNLGRIAILEEMAQLMYREWFVHFRFPGHQSVRMVDSSRGPIPERWEATTLGEVLAELESGSRPRGGAESGAGGIPSVGAENILGLGKYDYQKEKYITPDFFTSMRRGHVRHGDVLLYKDGANIGRKSLFRDGFPHAECAINEHVFILRCNDRCTQSYLYLWLDQPEMIQNIRNLNANAAQPGINQSGVRSLPILIPERSTLEAFEGLVEPLLALLFGRAKGNRTLSRTRDLLLPKMISGELDVTDLDIDTGGPEA